MLRKRTVQKDILIRETIFCFTHIRILPDNLGKVENANSALTHLEKNATIKKMAKFPETLFSEKVQRDLRKRFPGIWFIKTQMVSRLGIPDIIGCYRGRFFAWELKVGHGKASKMQLHILKRIAHAGGIARVVHPENLELAMGQIESEA